MRGSELVGNSSQYCPYDILRGSVTNLDGIALCVYRGKIYLVSIFGFYFSVRTVVHAVKFQTLHTVAQICAKCSVICILTYAIFLRLPITFNL